MSERLRYWLAALAAILWIASFLLPAVRTGQGWQMGWQIAIMGWAGPLDAQFGWYANLLMIPALGVLALGEPKGDFDAISKLGLALFLFWLNTLFWTGIPLDGGGRQEIVARGAGFYAWMAALLIAWLGLFVLGRRGRSGRRVGITRGDDDALEREGGAMLEGRA